MNLKAGIVGLPNVGKSTLFNAITKQNILSANYPFATIEPNKGMVVVPDERLKELVTVYNTKKEVPTMFEFTDIAGLVKGASLGEGLGNKFLSHIREVDAIVEVVRCFDNDEITHVEGIVDPIRDIEIVATELMLADLETIIGRLIRIEKKAIQTKDKDMLVEVGLLHRVKLSLEQGNPVRAQEFTAEESVILKSFNLLSAKPIIYVANVSEDEINIDNENVKKVRLHSLREGAEVIKISARIEEELSELEDLEKRIFLEELGIPIAGLDLLIKATYNLLGLKTYFTCGEIECRAWTFKSGMRAPECAGIIHTDFEKGFIRAEVVSYEDIITFGSELKAKNAGKVRLEGKDYLVNDGDICHFRFNV